MNGTINQYGEVTLTWNTQAEILSAPALPDGTPMKYLPCETCGGLQTVALNVESIMCLPCYERGPCTGQCDECGRDVYGDVVLCDDCQRPTVVIYA